MSLVIFAVVFMGVSGIIIYLACNMVGSQKLNYTTLYIRNTARGVIGLFETNSVLEIKRKGLHKKNSKF